MFNLLPQVAEAFPRAIGQAVRKIAFDIQAQAMADTPVDTGNLRASIYTKTSKGNNYPGNADTNIIADQVPEADELTAYVAVAANYGIYVEMGTRYAPAQPFLGPAVAKYAQNFDSVMAKFEDTLMGLL